MKVIKPVVFDESMLVASNVAEDEYPAFIAEATYALGKSVVFNHAVYESAEDGNTGNTPHMSPLAWTYIGPTNKFRMFDDEWSSQTEAAGPIEVTFAPGLTNSLAVLELEGVSIDVEVRDGAGGELIYEASKSLETSYVSDWYQYFFSPFVKRREVVFTDLPTYGSAHITLKINGQNTKCGHVAAGTHYFIGKLLAGANAGIIDYSRKETSATGVTRLQKRKYSKRMSGRLLVYNQDLDYLHWLLASLRSTPCVWLGTDSKGYEPLTVYGFYKDFNIDIAYTAVSHCSLDIEGLT